MSTSSTLPAGTTEECLKDFFQRFRWESARPLVAELTGVEEPTVRRWFNGILPTGLPLLRLRVILVLLGYKVEEYVLMPTPSQQFGKALALGVLDVDDALFKTGYKSSKDVYSLVLRGATPYEYRWNRIERYVEDSKEEIAAAEERVTARLADLPLDPGYQPATPEADASDPAPPCPTPLQDRVLGPRRPSTREDVEASRQVDPEGMVPLDEAIAENAAHALRSVHSALELTKNRPAAVSLLIHQVPKGELGSLLSDLVWLSSEATQD